jgi:hypothetical protein
MKAVTVAHREEVATVSRMALTGFGGTQGNEAQQT